MAAQVALRRQQSSGGTAREGEAAALAARKRAYRARLRTVQISRHYTLPDNNYETMRSSDPVWSERVRRRKAFADASLEQPMPLPAPGLCSHLLAALLHYVPPQPRPKISFSIESIIETMRSSDPVWSERVRRRKAFADASLEQPMPLPAPGLCSHLLAALLHYVPPQPRPKISFSIESIIGVQ
ncbi:hypothetical protein KGM_215662 [Danaus plexippus plexippus]|uniref:Uncharacterized protein n=1 Tax=Danaus plexippus plexippus TaxID=278856 RepID=A0A212FF48_DANPL|nr:hypothetical protein KGM_215662 [Danaus plexippus plexippus]